MIGRMAPVSYLADLLVPAAQTTTGDMLPYIVVFGAGFLVAAWGKSLGSAIAVAAGLMMVIAAIIGFIVEFPVCPDGTTCF
jgi:hypothetical protein